MKVVIQAVSWNHQRADNARHLAEQTGGTIVWDTEHDPFGTFLRVLDAFGDEAGWLIEDDVTLCADWPERAAQVAAEHPEDVIRAFSLTTTRGWLPGLAFYSMACTYFPAGAARAILDYAGTLSRQTHRQEALDQLHDHLVGLWLDHLGRDYWLHTPSLVQHREWPSLVDPRGRAVSRLSPTFEGTSPLP